MAKEKKKNKGVEKTKGLFQEFKAFISRGNVFDMAVGVVIGGAFSAIVTAVVNVLLSLCTWAVPGGLAGLITVLPAVNSVQEGVVGIGQKFAAADLADMTIKFAESQGVVLTTADASFPTWQANLLTKYTLYGSTYAYNASAVINWGAVINAVISFLIIAIVLFIVVKVINTIRESAEKAKSKIKEDIEGKAEEEPAEAE